MKKTGRKIVLGDLIAALFEEANKYSSEPMERKLMVYAALKDLLSRQVSTKHPVVLKG